MAEETVLDAVNAALGTPTAQDGGSEGADRDDDPNPASDADSSDADGEGDSGAAGEGDEPEGDEPEGY